MVFLSRCLLAKRKTGFVDHLRIFVRGGAGGQGFPKYGGRGGRGGNVYMVATDRSTLREVLSKFPKKRIAAGTGGNSKASCLAGAAGEDLHLSVPSGVSVYRDDGKFLGDVNEAGEKVLLARGGPGGSSENQFLGQKGQAHSLTLDLKLIADIGLVGFPNAGKSTLLSAISRASPKIASYPFTTIKPQIGTMMYEDHRQISMADLPGLIEGAHVNVGMGHHFLKHVERTKTLLFVVDVNGFKLGVDYPHRTAFQTILLLINELGLYKEDLIEKPAVLILNKIDIDESEIKTKETIEKVKYIQDALLEEKEELRPERLIKFDDIIPISAKERINTDYVKTRLRELLDVYADRDYEFTNNDDKLALIDERNEEKYQKGRDML